MIADDVLWKQAQEIAAKEYEAENGEAWEDADKYTREDWVYSVYRQLKENKEI